MRIAERSSRFCCTIPQQLLPAAAGEWHLAADRRLREAVGDLHAQFRISTRY